MTTPIVDFVKKYADSSALRLHMPGHKGVRFLGFEQYDITEIDGADSLYEADGIIAESESNASRLFGCPTYYSTEGSSLCIRAMMYLVCLWAKAHDQKPLIFAGRNAHKTLISAAALLDFDIKWLMTDDDSYLSCNISAEMLDKLLTEAPEKPAAVYITSPDYLGNMPNIAALAEVCHKHGVLLAVDNAHGAYLRFLQKSLHPLDLGADICCDSAHKTLPVLTGGAYLHISSKLSADFPEIFSEQVKGALALFGSTSPSYLIMQSLDMANEYLDSGYRKRLCEFLECVRELKNKLSTHGFRLTGNEPMKLTISTKEYGYTGRELADTLLGMNIVSEFSDSDNLVLMLTPETTAEGLLELEEALLSIPRRASVNVRPPKFHLPECVMSAREAAFSVSEVVSAKESIGRILSAATVGCPPAVPVVVSGERIDESAVRCFEYYGITECVVVK